MSFESTMKFLTSFEFGVGVLLGGIVYGGIALGLLGASTGTGISPGKCTSYVIDATGDDWYVATSGRTLIAQLEPDTASTGTGTEVEVSCCTGQSANECDYDYWDSDQDGADDTYTLNGSSFPYQRRSIRISNCPGFVLFDTSAYSDDAKLVVCGADY